MGLVFANPGILAAEASLLARKHPKALESIDAGAGSATR